MLNLRYILKNLSTYTLPELVELWEVVSEMKVNQCVAEVRGWILEALEKKAPEAMDEYYDGFYEDEELRKIVLKS